MQRYISVHYVVSTHIQDDVLICHMYVAMCLVILNGSVYSSRHVQSGQGGSFSFFFFWHFHVVLLGIDNSTCVQCKQALSCCTVNMYHTSEFITFFIGALVCIYLLMSLGYLVSFETPLGLQVSLLFWKD